MLRSSLKVLSAALEDNISDSVPIASCSLLQLQKHIYLALVYNTWKIEFHISLQGNIKMGLWSNKKKKRSCGPLSTDLPCSRAMGALG